MNWWERFYKKDFASVVGFASKEQTQKETRFVLDVLRLAPGARVLDLCCGYGRHSMELALQSEIEVTGLDFSRDYLAIAQQKYAHPRVQYVHGDMRFLPFSGEFDAVVHLFTSFGFFKTDKENQAVLSQVARALKTGGLYLLDCENKYYFLLNDALQKRRYWEQDGEGNLYLSESFYDAVREREIFLVKKISPSAIEQSEYNIRLYGLPEIKRMLAVAGLQLAHYWGDFDASEYTWKSRRLITLARKV